jgi:hypothetical protein
MALAADHGAARFSLGSHRFMAALALKMECILQGNRILGRFPPVAGAARLPFSATIVQIGIKIMMALEAVNFIRVDFMLELNGRSFMRSQFTMVQNYYRLLGKSQGNRNGEKHDDQQQFQVLHRNSFRCESRKPAFPCRIQDIAGPEKPGPIHRHHLR